MSEWIVDVGDPEFEREVLERSERVPVVVDFWAPWCGPCRTLGPVLERLAEEHAGAFVLARVNADEAPAAAQAFGVRSIPAVKAFRDGALVAEFVGAQPESVVRQFLAPLLPTEADREVAGAERAAADGDADTAEAGYRAALALDGRHPGALLGLAGTLAARDRRAEALELLEQVAGSRRDEERAERLAAELRTAGGAADLEALRASAAARPDDLDAALDLGRALAAAGRHEAALETLLEVVRRDPGHAEGAARQAMIDLFALRGADDPLTQRFRSELARALFR